MPGAITLRSPSAFSHSPSFSQALTAALQMMVLISMKEGHGATISGGSLEDAVGVLTGVRFQ